LQEKHLLRCSTIVFRNAVQLSGTNHCCSQNRTVRRPSNVFSAGLGGYIRSVPGRGQATRTSGSITDMVRELASTLDSRLRGVSVETSEEERRGMGEAESAALESSGEEAHREVAGETPCGKGRLHLVPLRHIPNNTCKSFLVCRRRGYVCSSPSRYRYRKARLPH
jgi:hypothetical protein